MHKLIYINTKGNKNQVFMNGILQKWTKFI